MNDNSYPSVEPDRLRQLLGPVRQLGYVVSDVEAAAAAWVQRLGVGPWRVRHGIHLENCQYLGKTMDVTVSIASSYSHGVEIELIAQPDGPPCMYSDFLEQSGAGAQHICFYPVDYHAAFDHLVGTGCEPILHGVIGTTHFAYLSDHNGQVVEIAGLDQAGLDVRAERAEAARTWDGTNPITVRS